ncbi:putative Histidine kinase [Candidatus Terasakiella magnetica]|uniref:histidine kinase n=1 Tax=Candidatus Terasakiella magnetica TaxID=1867952 RepID=A0A1C3RGA6_9PROT|nr:hybrid sensor histidine kinase/response regulator [Candidatus Terasakiella magnetica]SCA56320.1 putative Histidine kinase [Candidatus Terasakiella magnetica]
MQWRRETLNELLDQAYKGAIPTGVFSICAACLFSYAFWNKIPLPNLLPWLALMLIAQTSRIAFSFYRAKRIDQQSYRFWKNALFISVLPGSLLWGIFPLFSFVHLDDISRVIISIFLATAPTAQLLSISGVFRLWLTSMVILLLPMCFTWMFYGLPGLALGLIGLLYAAYLYAVGRKFNQLMGDKIQLTYKANAVLRAKTTFLATASHDLRQPLHAITMSLAAAEARLLDETPSKQDIDAAYQSLETATHSVENLTRLLNSLMDVSKLESGGVKPNHTAISLSNIFDHLSRTFENSAKEKGLEFQIVPSSLRVTSDPIYFQRIVSNLVSNAVQHVSDGKILIGCRRRADSVVISVLDNGPGIPPEKFRDIFEEFHQLDNPGRKSSGGQGLGLAIADRLARVLGHNLSVSSLPGAGSVFSVEVPLHKAHIPSQTPKNSAQSNRRRPLVVLINPFVDVLEETAVQIRQWEYRVLAFQSYEEAQNLQIRPQLIICPERFPNEMTGCEAAERLRSVWKHNCAALILIQDLNTDKMLSAAKHNCKTIQDPPAPDEFKALIQDEIQNLTS